MYRSILYSVGIVLLFASKNFSQSSDVRVLVQNTKATTALKPFISIKWYSQSLVYPKGVNIYRKELGQEAWVKLNKSPLLIQKSVPAQLQQRDADLEAFVEMAKEMGSAQDNGFLLLNLFVKSFQSSDYAKLIGIQYDDMTATWGNSYEYKINRVEKNGEIELSTSPSIKVGEYKPNKAVDKFKISTEKAIAKMTWEEDQDRFYGVNIYRSSSTDSTWRKLNKTPIVQSATEGAPELESMFQDNKLKEGVGYRYKIVGLDFFGEETISSEIIEVFIGDLTPPTPPFNLEKKVAILDVSISWQVQPSPDLKGFELYRSPKSDGAYTKINTQLIDKADTIYRDKVPEPGFYYYYLAAVDEAGNEGKSERLLVEVQDMVPPSMPQWVVAKADTGKVILTWSANVEKDLKGYYIYRSIESAGKETFVLTNAEALHDTTFTQVFAKNASNKFLFKVAAVDTSFNISQPSEIVAAQLPDVTAPIKPLLKQIVSKGDSVTLLWLSNPELDLKGFNLYRYKASEPNNKTRINNSLIPSDIVRYIDTLSTAGHYFYVLQAIDASNNLSPVSEPYPIEIANSFLFSFSEVKVKYLRKKRAVSIQWAENKNPMGYTVFRKSADNPAWKPVTGLLQKHDATDTYIAKKSVYEYQVRAYSATGDVVISKSVSITTGK
jgi:hypothetical protein